MSRRSNADTILENVSPPGQKGEIHEIPDLEGEKKKVSPSVNFPFLSDPGADGLEGCGGEDSIHGSYTVCQDVLWHRPAFHRINEDQVWCSENR